jgi:hypothetical protein
MKATKKPPAYDTARLPQALRERGKPIAVHRPWREVFADAQRRFLARIFGDNWRGFGRGYGPIIQRVLLFALSFLFFCGGLVALWVYFFNPPTNEDPRWPLGVGIVMLIFSAVALVLGVFYTWIKLLETRMLATPKVQRTDTPDAYLVYKDGLAAVTGDEFEFMEWSTIEEVSWIWIRWGRHLGLTDKDGRQMVVWQLGYTEAGELLQAIYVRVNDFLVPRTLKSVAAGKTVDFGLFALTKGGLKYKGRTAKWADVTSMKLSTRGGDSRLIIYVRGRFIPWSWCNVDTIPNWQTFYDALCKLAPDRLLIKTTKPRW